MHKREQDFQSKFNRWLKYNWHETSAFELKFARNGSLAFSAIEAHQIQNLKNAKNRKIIFKIPDDSRGQKPFDCFVIKGAKGLVAIQYEETPEEFVLIDVDTLTNEIATSKRKSLTRERALEIGDKHTLNIIESML